MGTGPANFIDGNDRVGAGDADAADTPTTFANVSASAFACGVGAARTSTTTGGNVCNVGKGIGMAVKGAAVPSEVRCARSFSFAIAAESAGAIGPVGNFGAAIGVTPACKVLRRSGARCPLDNMASSVANGDDAASPAGIAAGAPASTAAGGSNIDKMFTAFATKNSQ